ncbi:Na+/melibiose symporter [Thermoanaerobacter thermohydrosulfuricus]|uniref:Major facilitator superfamily MFS_1 n=3 Tax=Thermoanaerobacter TaxID=1754 RepID=G2MSB9_9THEO|nr:MULTISPECIES: MFS transporter [Thermoanaerobacter]AEM78513.1 LOW QUALITY PROTEIN: major facilitator superfamily MFS_1 [Thermoanaerobacter wiegelii Rt8.B1]EMT38181.1 Na+/melibiose symporter-like protein [Thermoanaerobacter thermohydrosulfuricus WC1]SDG62515.1 Na+/melibiose symporter [Thermoanaerobacter thermohydrosulfuricus]
MSSRLNYLKIFNLGLGFMVISMIWAAYNAYMPIFLGNFTKSNTLIGFVMSWDNIANLFILPFFGALSDNTRTRIGRRMPYILVSMPLAGVLYALLPLQTKLLSLLVIDLLFNIVVATYRTPMVALMPDIVEEEHRSKANGVINFMGGLGSLIIFFIGSQLYKINKAYPFFLSGILSLIIPIVLFLTIKEPKIVVNEEKKEKQSILKALATVVKDQNKAPFYTLLSIFMTIAGFAAVETFFTRYCKIALGIDESVSSFAMGFYALAFLVFALPAGFIATKIGKRKTMMIGAFGQGILFLIFMIVRDFRTIQILMPFAGMFNALFTINSYPLVVSYTSAEKIGTYTGLYYFFSSLAAIVTPSSFGAIMDFIGFNKLFLAASICLFISFAFLWIIGEKYENTMS